MKLYIWRVEFMHAQNAFAKRFEVTAESMVEAVKLARAGLNEKGYDGSVFDCTSAVRGTQSGVS